MAGRGGGGKGSTELRRLGREDKREWVGEGIDRNGRGDMTRDGQ